MWVAPFHMSADEQQDLTETAPPSGAGGPAPSAPQVAPGDDQHEPADADEAAEIAEGHS